MVSKGDTEKQAFLRSRMTKEKGKAKRGVCTSEIASVLQLKTLLLEIGCGTAHIIHGLARCFRNAVLIGVDVSPAMLKIVKKDLSGSFDIGSVMGDDLQLPFKDNVFNIVMSRLAEYSNEEACRTLKSAGIFFEY